MRSDAVKTGTQQAPHRSLFNALGMTKEEMERPLVGIVCSYNEIVPGHMNLDKIAQAVKLGVAMAGGTPVMFPAITATATPVIRFSIRRQKASRRFGRHTMRRLRCFWRGIGRIWRGTGMLRSFQSRPQAKTCSTCPAFPGRALQAST